jgi:hypothetical protein
MKKNFFFASFKSLKKGVGSGDGSGFGSGYGAGSRAGSISQRYGSGDPDHGSPALQISIWIVPCQHRSSTSWDRKRISNLFDPDPAPQPISRLNPGPELIEPDTDVMI